MSIEKLDSTGVFASAVNQMVKQQLDAEGLDERTVNHWLQVNGIMYGYVKDSKLLGFILCLEYPTYIYVMAITTIVPRSGIGSLLLEHAILNHDKDFWVKVRISNTASIALFRKYGFKKQSKKSTPNELQKSYRTEYYPFFRRKSKYHMGFFDLYQECNFVQDCIKKL